MQRYLGIIIVIFFFETNAQISDFKIINFKKADSVAAIYSNASLQNIPLLAHQLTSNFNTQVEKFRAIHTWVCLNIESDYYLSEATLRKRNRLANNLNTFTKWHTKAQSKVLKKLIRDKKTICSGYAYLLKTLTNLVDIECEIVNGYGRTTERNLMYNAPNHSWNVVKLHGKYYFADTTQASGYYNLELNLFVKDYNEGYFLPDPVLFSKNHYPLDKKWLLLKEIYSLQNFFNAPIIYGNTYKYGITPLQPKKLINLVQKGTFVSFKFKILNTNSLKEVVIHTTNLSDNITLLNKNYNNGILELQYIFNRKGYFDVHAKVAENIVTSYSFKVK